MAGSLRSAGIDAAGFSVTACGPPKPDAPTVIVRQRVMMRWKLMSAKQEIRQHRYLHTKFLTTFNGLTNAGSPVRRKIVKTQWRDRAGNIFRSPGRADEDATIGR